MSVLFVTGAGISANAGIPIYRERGSSWIDEDLEKKSHAAQYGNHLDELWDKHWGPMSLQMQSAEPTYTHQAIAAFQKKHDAIIATQNIDNLHERAGSDNVAHLHGSLAAKCMRCKGISIEEWSGAGAPVCRDCESKKTRPDVILFGEELSAKLMRGLSAFASKSRVIAVGTSLNVFPAAGLVMDHTARAIIINKEPTMFDKWVRSVHHEDCDQVIDDVLAEVDASLSI